VSRRRDCPSCRRRDLRRAARPRDYSGRVTPSEFAAVEIALWEQALAEQHLAERRLEQARRQGPRLHVAALTSQVEALRIRADLRLAEAVQAQCEFRHGGPVPDEATSTRMELPGER
jgi:hypothetical protein